MNAIKIITEEIHRQWVTAVFDLLRKAFVKRVEQRIPLRIFRFRRSTHDLLLCSSAGRLRSESWLRPSRSATWCAAPGFVRRKPEIHIDPEKMSDRRRIAVKSGHRRLDVGSYPRSNVLEQPQRVVSTPIAGAPRNQKLVFACKTVQIPPSTPVLRVDGQLTAQPDRERSSTILFSRLW